MRCIVLIGLLAILLFLVAGCGDRYSTPSPSATQEPTNTSTSTPAIGGANASQSLSDDIELAGETTWTLESLDGQPVLETSVITLRIGDNWIDGIDGCNSYGGRSEERTPVAGAEGVFSIPPFGVTEMLCPEPEGVMDQADAYMEALVQGERFRITDDRLEILDGGGARRLIFVRRAPLPGSPIDLKGTAWRLLIEGDAMDGVRVPTLSFLDDRLVTGATACRSYVATGQASEGALRFPGKRMLGSSQSWQSCVEQERTLEGEFTDFLTWAREYSVDEEGGASRLRIWSIRGKTLTFEPLPQAEDISDTDWSLTAFVELMLDSGMWHHRTAEVIQGTKITIDFDDHSISGFTGCNSYRGPAMFESGSVTVDRQSFYSTTKLCEVPEGLTEQEKRYLSLVQRATRYGISGDSLFMQTDDDVLLLFQAEEMAETPVPAAAPEATPTAIPTPASEPSPGTLSARDVLDSMTAAMSALDSGYIEIEVTTKLSAGDGSQQTVTMEIVGDFQAPDRSRVNMSIDTDDDSAEFEIITIEDKTYLKLPDFDRWAISTGSITPYGDLFSFGAFSTDFDAGVVASFNSPIREVFVGESVHYVRGPVSGYALADLLGMVEDTDGEDVAEFGEGVVEFRIGVDDFLVRKMVIEAELPDEEGTLSMQVNMTLSDFGKPVDIQVPDPETGADQPGDQTGATTEVLENGWIRVDLAQQGFGFAISVPPLWELDTTKDEWGNLRSGLWLQGKDTSGPDSEGLRLHFVLQIDLLFSAYADLEEYTDIYIANTAFFADIDELDIESEKVSLPAGDAFVQSFSNISPTRGIRLSHAQYILAYGEDAFIITFTSPSEIFDEVRQVLEQIAETIELYDP